MTRRSLFKLLAGIPFLGFLKPEPELMMVDFKRIAKLLHKHRSPELVDEKGRKYYEVYYKNDNASFDNNDCGYNVGSAFRFSAGRV